jgi:hypothetical protein
VRPPCPCPFFALLPPHLPSGNPIWNRGGLGALSPRALPLAPPLRFGTRGPCARKQARVFAVAIIWLCGCPCFSIASAWAYAHSLRLGNEAWNSRPRIAGAHDPFPAVRFSGGDCVPPSRLCRGFGHVRPRPERPQQNARKEKARPYTRHYICALTPSAEKWLGLFLISHLAKAALVWFPLFVQPPLVRVGKHTEHPSPLPPSPVGAGGKKYRCKSYPHLTRCVCGILQATRWGGKCRMRVKRSEGKVARTDLTPQQKYACCVKILHRNDLPLVRYKQTRKGIVIEKSSVNGTSTNFADYMAQPSHKKGNWYWGAVHLQEGHYYRGGLVLFFYK